MRWAYVAQVTQRRGKQNLPAFMRVFACMNAGRIVMFLRLT